MIDDRLYRSNHERMISGVAGGVAERLDIDPSIVRILWVLLVLPTGFLALVAYVVMAIVVPEEPEEPATEARPGDSASVPTGGPTPEEGGNPPPATAPAWVDPRAQRRADREARRAARRARGSGGAVVFGGILVVLGVLFLARQFLPELDFDLVWPIALILLGVALVIGSVRRD